MLNKIKSIDYPIILILILLMGIGTVTVYSATFDHALLANYFKKNLINYALGFICLIAVAFVNYRYIFKLAYFVYAFGIGLLVAVYYYGITINAARGWFDLKIMHFQPAELMKLLLIIALAHFIARNKGEPLLFFRHIVPMVIFTLIPFALVLMQPDLGNAIIYVAILIGMLWIGNVKYLHVLIAAVVIGISMVASLHLYSAYHDDIEQYFKEQGKGHWVKRIDTFLDPENASRDDKYQVENSIRAIGSGGLKGDSFLQGNSVHNGYIPYAYSDSIFVVIGEEFGFIGSSFLLLLYFLLIYRLIVISIQSSDHAGSFFIIGIVSMFVFQIFENVGMLIGIMPLTGITLPFISYGGSSLLINMLSVGIVLSIRMHRQQEE